MAFRELEAPSGASLLEAAWSVEGGAGATLVLPDGCTDLVFDPQRRRVSVVGVMTTAVVTGPSSTHLFGLRLHPWVVRAVFGVSAHELRDREVELERLHPTWFARLRAVARVEDAIEAFGDECERRRVVDDLDERLVVAASRLQTRSVSAAADSAGLSERQLLRLFLDHVGLSPKGYQRVRRLQHFVRDTRSPTLASAAGSAGYADQSHLTREVRSLTGTSPRSLFSGARPG